MEKLDKQSICPKCGGTDIEKEFKEKGSGFIGYGGDYLGYSLKKGATYHWGVCITPRIEKDKYLTDTVVCTCSCGYTWDTLPLDSNVKEEDILKLTKKSKLKAERKLKKYIEEEKIKATQELKNTIYLENLEQKLISKYSETKGEGKQSKEYSKKTFWCKLFKCKKHIN